MRESDYIVSAIKALLREQGKTYADLAKRLGLSESNIKRMFSKRAISLNKLERIAGALNITIFEITDRAKLQRAGEWHQFTLEEEKTFIANPKLTAFMLLVINRIPLAQIIRRFRLSHQDTERFLLKLDRMGIIELRDKRRYTVKISAKVRPIPHGPIEKHGSLIVRDRFLNASFNREADYFRILFSKLTKETALRLKARLLKIAQEMFEESVAQGVHQETAHTYGLIIAFRESDFSLIDLIQKSGKDLG